VGSGHEGRLRVLRVSHSGVVTAWRERERQLNADGAGVTLISPKRWNEGGADVELEPGSDTFVTRVGTLGRHPYRFLYNPIGLFRVLRSDDFDVVDIHEEPASIASAEVQLIAWLARRRAPVCMYSAQNIEKRYPPPFRWLERIALRRAGAVHTCNDGVETILRRKGFRGLIRNLGLGVDVDRFAPRRAPESDTTLRVGYVGRLEPHKGVSILVAAAAHVPGCTVEIVGDGPERVAIEQEIARMGLSERVRVVGFADEAELPAAYRRFDVVVVPSLETPGWIEQFGRVAVEAMAAGRAVVASQSGALPEVIGDAGVLVPPGDPAALAATLVRLAADRPERQRLGELAQERAQRFSWASIARHQLSLYRDVLDAT
jgi:glycosyltransferase involved in cell wall biosynthesis